MYLKVKKQPNNIKLYKYFLSYRNILNNDIRRLRKSYYVKKFNDCSGDCKKTWNVLTELTGQNVNSPSFSLEINNLIINEPLSVANMINKYFLSVASNKIKSNIQPVALNEIMYRKYFNQGEELSSMYIVPVLSGDVVKNILAMKNGKAPGIDGINAFIAKIIYLRILYFLCIRG